MSDTTTPLPAVSELIIPLERDNFLRTLLRNLAGTLQKVVGLEEASGFVSFVGQEIGDEINRACPFADKVFGRPALTSNDFGSIAADNLGYAKVAIEQAIAQCDLGCRLVVYLKPTPEAEAAQGREYFQG